MRLKLFFCYYGGKYRIAPKYPKPIHDTIIEPFAGAAGYSHCYPEKQIFLYDLNERICGVWDYLIKVSEQEILNLPIIITDVREMNVCQEAKWLIGYWCNKGNTEPRNKPSTWMKSGLRPNSQWGEAIKKRIADQLQYIRHWRIKCQSYENIENQKATWFIDPPYEGRAGNYYTYNEIDYQKLANFCISLEGQKIVCENVGAKWLPFEPFCSAKSLEGKNGRKKSQEAIWLRN